MRGVGKIPDDPGLVLFYGAIGMACLSVVVPITVYVVIVVAKFLGL